MNNNFSKSRILVFAALFVAIVGMAVWQASGDGVVTTLQPGDDAQQVEGLSEARDLVREFGDQLNDVSLLSPGASEQIQSEYAPYVSDTLLEEWFADPQSAPGRTTSSPFPDRIEIGNSVTENTDGSLTLSGEIILMTSVERGSSDQDNAGTQPVEITVEEINGEWQIVNFVTLPSNDTATNTPANLQAYFVEQIQIDALSRMVGHPIEGIEQSMYLDVYPGLTSEDFSGVETMGDTNTSDVMTSADATITESGLRTLFENVVDRLDVDIESRSDVDALLERLAGDDDSTNTPQSPSTSEEDNLSEQCEIEGGNWLEAHSECEHVDAQWCNVRGGEFEGCASACRYDADAEVCIDVCVPVCSFN